MRWRTAIFYCAAAIIVSSCDNNTRTTPNGHDYTVLKEGDGKIVKSGEVLMLDMIVVDKNDSIWYDSRDEGYPTMISISDVSETDAELGIHEAFRTLSKGDSIAFTTNAKNVFRQTWNMNVPAAVDPESDFTYRITCLDVVNEEVARKFMLKRDSIRSENEKVELAMEDAEVKEYNKIQLGKDTIIIDNFLKGKNVRAINHPSGMRYVIKTKGTGPEPQFGDIVNIKFSGQLLDGKEFESGEVNFALGDGDVIKAWDYIASSMKKGTSLTLFVPSSLAYGRGGRPPLVGADAILVYDMELLSIGN